MSLQIPTVFDSELSAPEAVHRVMELHYRAPNTLTVYVGVWANLRASRDLSKPPVERRVFEIYDFDPKGPDNLHTQIYRWLKTQSAYSGVYAVDDDVTIGYTIPVNAETEVVVTTAAGEPLTPGVDYVVENGVVTQLDAAQRSVRARYQERRHDPAVDI